MPKNFYSLVALTTSFAVKSLATDVACKTVKNEAALQFTSGTFIVLYSSVASAESKSQPTDMEFTLSYQ